MRYKPLCNNPVFGYFSTFGMHEMENINVSTETKNLLNRRWAEYSHKSWAFPEYKSFPCYKTFFLDKFLYIKSTERTE